jgi:GNAT superfamily N-acetyltransferase
MYIPMIRLEFVTLVLRQTDNKLVGVGIGLPSMSIGLRNAKGRFLPNGWYHLYKALKGNGHGGVLDLLMIAVDPEYQGKGVNALMFNEFIPAANKSGMTAAESNVELEDNSKVHSLWNGLDVEQHKRRRAYIKNL